MNSTARRLQAEWDLLQELASLNPNRIPAITAADQTFTFVLRGCGARLTCDDSTLSDHNVSIRYPSHFPAVPLELYVAEPFLHPNVHPETGFVCLWEQHSSANTAEDAIHKLVAMLAGRLFNLKAPHVMQPEALRSIHPVPDIQPLKGIARDTLTQENRSSTSGTVRRSRLT